jgi:hypothetical protein
MPEVAHLVEDTTERPNIRLVAVWLILEQFWRHIVWSTNACVGKIFGAVKNLSNTKITETDLAILQEDVLSLHISVQDLTFMQIEQGEPHLDEPLQDLVFAKVLALGGLDLAVDVAFVAINHDDVQILFAVYITVLVRNDVRVSNLLQQSHLVLGVLKILLLHVSGLHSLDDVVFALSLVSCHIDLTEGARPNGLDDFVYIHLIYFRNN